MRIGLRPLVLLHADPAFRDRARRLSRGRFDLRAVQGWNDLEEQMRETSPSGIGVVDPYHGRQRHSGMAPELGCLLRRLPSATLVAALHARPGWMDDVRTLGAWGIAGVIDLEAETTDSLVLKSLEMSRSRALRSLLTDELGLGSTGRGRVIVDAAIGIVTSGGYARDLAKELHMHRDTLLRWCASAGLPPPRRLLLWMRVLLAAELLDNPGQTVGSVAAACGYSCDTALARAVRRLVGASPSELRSSGALRSASVVFRRELDALRGRERSG
jgi:AraC-like DNA-binding protein